MQKKRICKLFRESSDCIQWLHKFVWKSCSTQHGLPFSYHHFLPLPGYFL